MHHGQRKYLTYFAEVDLNQLVIVTVGVRDKAFLILISQLGNLCKNTGQRMDKYRIK